MEADGKSTASAATSAAIVRLIELVREGDVAQQVAAAGEIKSLGLSVIPLLIEALRCMAIDPGLRLTDLLAAFGLDAVPRLREALADPHPFVRYHAARALGRIGSSAEAAVPELTSALNDSHVDVRAFASEALQRIRGEEVDFFGSGIAQSRTHQEAHGKRPSCLRELVDLLVSKFGHPQHESLIFVDPDQLCDIVETWADILTVEYHTDSCGLSRDMTYVRLFDKDKPGHNITFAGLFSFLREKAARDNEYHYALDATGRGATNFRAEWYGGWVNNQDYIKYPIDPHALRARLQERRQTVAGQLSTWHGLR